MIYDDVGDDERNPFPGKVFNASTAEETPGKDLREGIAIDYIYFCRPD
jgi:glycosylphosphatidylinositol transamidase (GPIT) subunit GPI8